MNRRRDDAVALAPLLVVLFWLGVAAVGALRTSKPVPVTDSQVFTALCREVGTNEAIRLFNER